MMTGMSIGLLILVVIFITWVVTGYHRLVRLKSLIDAAWHEIDMPLKCRSGLIKKFALWAGQHEVLEKELIEAIGRARAESKGARTIEQKAQAELVLDSAVLALNVAIARYPELVVHAELVQLQKELDAADDDIHVACRYYNGAVRHYNLLVENYPARLVALLTGFSTIDYFLVNDAPEHRK
jgi:LemA protein